MREISVISLKEKVKEMLIKVNYELSDDMKKALRDARKTETSPVGKNILSQLDENMEIARKKQIPICQDTGMAVIFLKIGQEVHFKDGDVKEALNEGVREAYEEGYLRKSVVGDPLLRENTRDNTPAVIHFDLVPGDKVKLSVTCKGFGSENMSRIYMLKPADGREGVVNSVVNTVKEAGPNACPPLVVGVGIGGTFEKAALMAKEALLRPAGEHSSLSHMAELEKEILEKINQLDIGPAGLGGDTTALAVNIESYPTHIAGLPVAVNLCCHVNRHAVCEL